MNFLMQKKKKKKLTAFIKFNLNFPHTGNNNLKG